MSEEIQEKCKKFDHSFTDFLNLSLANPEFSGDIITSVLIYHICCGFLHSDMSIDELKKSIENQWGKIILNESQESIEMESKKEKGKIKKVLGEFKHGDLHSGSKTGPKVNSKPQAVAIALSEARKAGSNIPKPKGKK